MLGGCRPIACTAQLPLVFRGAAEVPNVALRTVGRPGVDTRESDIIASMYAGSALSRPVTSGVAARTAVMQEMAAASRDAIPAQGFEAEARRIAALMRSRYNLGFVDIGGWDTHIAEGGGSGQLANRLGELGRGLAAYAQELGTAWRNAIVIVVSEFGRTFRENGNRGTDHGHGSVYWILGGAVRGGRIAGAQVAVRQDTLFQDRDYPVLNEYRALLGGLFARVYGLSPSRVAQVFPGIRSLDLGLA